MFEIITVHELIVAFVSTIASIGKKKPKIVTIPAIARTIFGKSVLIKVSVILITSQIEKQRQPLKPLR